MSSYGSKFFFFQAEDGIRAGHVTGVQTCALPILVDQLRIRVNVLLTRGDLAVQRGDLDAAFEAYGSARDLAEGNTSDEIGRARVGKESRSRGARHERKKRAYPKRRATRGRIRRCQ